MSDGQFNDRTQHNTASGVIPSDASGVAVLLRPDRAHEPGTVTTKKE